MYKDVTAFFLLLCCGAGAVRLDGAGRMFHDCDWSVLFNGFDVSHTGSLFCVELTVGTYSTQATGQRKAAVARNTMLMGSSNHLHTRWAVNLFSHISQ